MVRAVRPDDVLPDASDHTEMRGQVIRKGTIAAFLANARLLEQHPDDPEVVAALRDLLPAVEAAGVFDVFELRSPELREVLGRG